MGDLGNVTAGPDGTVETRIVVRSFLASVVLDSHGRVSVFRIT